MWVLLSRWPVPAPWAKIHAREAGSSTETIFPRNMTPRVGALVIVKTGGVAQQWRVSNIKIATGTLVTIGALRSGEIGLSKNVGVCTHWSFCKKKTGAENCRCSLIHSFLNGILSFFIVCVYIPFFKMNTDTFAIEYSSNFFLRKFSSQAWAKW